MYMVVRENMLRTCIIYSDTADVRGGRAAVNLDFGEHKLVHSHDDEGLAWRRRAFAGQRVMRRASPAATCESCATARRRYDMPFGRLAAAWKSVE